MNAVLSFSSFFEQINLTVPIIDYQSDRTNGNERDSIRPVVRCAAHEE